MFSHDCLKCDQWRISWSSPPSISGQCYKTLSVLEVNLLLIQHKQSSQIPTSKIVGGQPYSDTSLYKVSEYSIVSRMVKKFMRQARFGGHRDPSVLPVRSYSLHLTTWGLFHKTLRIHKLQICRNGQILTVNLLVSCKNSVIYSHFAVNYDEKKSFTEQFYGGPKYFLPKCGIATVRTNTVVSSTFVRICFASLEMYLVYLLVSIYFNACNGCFN